MEILQKGDLNRKEKPLKFSCNRCGCVFVATINEYETADFFEAQDGITAKCECPTCKRMVYLDR